MRIGELAEATGVTTQTIRYYESIDLMKGPDRTPSGYREHGNAALERLRFVRQAQGTGLTLSEINAVPDLKDAGARSCEHTQTLLIEHLADRAAQRDPAACTHPNRCQVIEASRHPDAPTRKRTYFDPSRRNDQPEQTAQQRLAKIEAPWLTDFDHQGSLNTPKTFISMTLRPFIFVGRGA